MAFKVLGIDHIGIACKDLQAGKDLWTAVGLPCTGEETVAEQKVTIIFYLIPNHSEVELLVGTSEDSPISKFIEKNGGRGGIQHMAIRVDDIVSAIADLQEKGIQMIDKAPRKGAGGADIAFVHPKSTGGVLLELCQHEDR